MYKGVLCGTLKWFPPLRETMDVEDPERKKGKKRRKREKRRIEQRKQARKS